MKQICKRANVPFFDLSARNSTRVCPSKCRQTMENKVTFILVQPFCPSASSNGFRHRYPSPLLFYLSWRAHFRKGDERKGFSLLSTKMHDEQLHRVHSNEKETPRLLFPRWWRKQTWCEKRSLHKGRERNRSAIIEISCSIFEFSW